MQNLYPPRRAGSGPKAARPVRVRRARRDLWRLPTHLAIVAVDGSPSHIALLADAIRRYASI